MEYCGHTMSGLGLVSWQLHDEVNNMIYLNYFFSFHGLANVVEFAERLLFE